MRDDAMHELCPGCRFLSAPTKGVRRATARRTCRRKMPAEARQPRRTRSSAGGGGAPLATWRRQDKARRVRQPAASHNTMRRGRRAATGETRWRASVAEQRRAGAGLAPPLWRRPLDRGRPGVRRRWRSNIHPRPRLGFGQASLLPAPSSTLELTREHNTAGKGTLAAQLIATLGLLP